jgi:hypothetical protein
VGPVDADRLPERLGQALGPLDDVFRAGHAAGRQEDPMDAPQGQLRRGQESSFPARQLSMKST